MIRKKIIFLYFFILFLLVFGYFVNSPLKKIGFYENVNDYMGIMIIPVLIFFILYGIVFSVKEKKKKIFLEIKLYLSLIFVFLGVYLLILYSLGISFNTINGLQLDNSFFKRLIDISLFEYYIGYFPTYVLYELMKANIYFPYPLSYYYYLLIGTEVVLLFLIAFNPTRLYIKNSNKNRRERKERKRIEEELEEQIRIKEEIERKEKIKFEEDKLKEEQLIKEKIEKYKSEKKKKNKKKKIKGVSTKEKFENKMANVSLKKTVTIKEDD